RAIDLRSPGAVRRLFARQEPNCASQGIIDLLDERPLVAPRKARTTESDGGEAYAAARELSASEHGLLAFRQLSGKRNGRAVGHERKQRGRRAERSASDAVM